LEKPEIQMLIVSGLSNAAVQEWFFSPFLDTVEQWQPVIILTEYCAWKSFPYSEEPLCKQMSLEKHRDTCGTFLPPPNNAEVGWEVGRRSQGGTLRKD